MFAYFPTVLIVLFLAVLVSVPATVLAIRERSSAFQVTLPVLAAIAVAGSVAFAIFSFNFSAAQDIKEANVIRQRAVNVEMKIQSEYALNGTRGSVLDDLVSVTDPIHQNAVLLSKGDTLTFKSQSGKDVTVRLTPSDKGADYYNAEVTYDGKPFELASGTYKADGEFDWASQNHWTNDYPLMNKKPVESRL